MPETKPAVKIEARNVCKVYETAAGPVTAVDNFSLDVADGEFVCIVGPSGSGKSTFIDLLPRLRDADSGSILIDGRPIADFSVDSLRDAIAFVPQHAQLFNVRVADHIGYGRPGASDAEVREAARLAGAADFIERLPGGYDMLLGEGGERLSGGQRQRLDLARALIRRAPILVLDEPTSHLDADSEQQLRAALARIRDQGETTIVIIAHRLSTIVEADRIIVFEQGRVTDCGTHHELVRRGRWYASAFSQQHGDNVERLQAATH
jgi:ABC-type multidrug transport system fused ATPase/permease subunit